MRGKRQANDQSWFDLEVQERYFSAYQTAWRFAILLEKLWAGIGQTIHFACQDWASTKAAYRFLSNDRVGEYDILSKHFNASAARFAATTVRILVLQDTTHRRSDETVANATLVTIPSRCFASRSIPRSDGCRP